MAGGLAAGRDRCGQTKRFVIRRERLRYARVDEVSSAFLEVMERNSDEADPFRQICRPPGQAAGLVVERRREIPGSRGLTMSGVFYAVDCPPRSTWIGTAFSYLWTFAFSAR